MKKICFVIMGYGKKTDPLSGKTYDLNITYNKIIKPAVKKAGFTCIRSDEIIESGIIDKNMYALLIQADLVIADITTFNFNATYELGIRHGAKRFATIVIKEKEGAIPFDISRNKIFSYSHMGNNIEDKEVKRCVKELRELIISVDKNQEIDSPLFYHIPSVKPYSLPENEYNQIIKNLKEKEDSIFSLTERAEFEMSKNNFTQAKKLWKKLVDKIENDQYYIQQQAFCTYKDETVKPNIALIDALRIISKLEPDNRNTIDPETLGITGAIYKRLWENNKMEIEYLDRSIEYYERGFTINQDYYTGENYALCLELKSEVTHDFDEKTYLKYAAIKARKEIIEIIDQLSKEEDFEIRSDLKWVYATLSHCYLGIKNAKKHKVYSDKFYELNPLDWQKATYEKSLKQLKKIHHTE
ncbi:tetratricopeptide repeat-containing protein [Winogradskyella sp.]|jgi:tetratricopeptide (TPR) repeat protein|uniref:tetratricopeptide repeat-containing protein n=1 Tax=Winogradskyella sp. TaxID=1883156 RepID=UPI0025F3B845|nr:tetratricopeptide repeat-containing protein [Winogradskyella sp.]MCT4628820.1 DUF4071 domain-containing protein [Winogradskyella sp.]